MTSKRPAAYFHKVRNKPDGFQRQDGEVVRARSKERYRENPKLAKFLSALWQEKNSDLHREYVRKSRQRDLVKSRERERQSYHRNRTPEKLAKMRTYSRAWRAAKKLAST